jgi:hypothetical protein
MTARIHVRASLLLVCLLAGLSPACQRRSTPPSEGPAEVHKERALGPRLIVQITVDQLRHDLVSRLLSLAGAEAKGFLRLTREGSVYDEAYYAHTNTETAVGHATLFTGALPRDHGIVANEWYDPQNGKVVMAVDDPGSTLVGAEGPGRSARSLLVPTLGDVLSEVTGGQAVVVSVSEKDRGAILPAGHKGRPYWLDDNTGHFITSSYYGTLPAWVSEREAAFSPEQLRGRTWELSLDASRYQAADDIAWERPFKHLGRVFPHELSPPDVSNKDFVKGLKFTPFGDELVLAFVRELFASEPIGRDDVPDLLAVSFSATDYVQHFFGPESREAEDNLVRLDRTLDALLTLAEQRATRERLLVVLSADHGATESPEYWLARGMDAGRIEPSELVSRMNAELEKRFGAERLIVDFVDPSFFLDEANIAERKLALADVEHALVELVGKEPGIYAAFSRSDALAGLLDHNELEKRITLSTHPTRSGHVYVVAKEHWMLSTGQKELASTHGSPWPSDSHVPILVWGMDVPPRHVSEHADPRMIVPTLAKRLGIPVPSGASATALPGL